MGPRFLLFLREVVKAIGVDFSFCWLVLGLEEWANARSVLPQRLR